VPWTAGGRQEACWDAPGPAHSGTRALGDGGGGGNELALALRELSFEEAESRVEPERLAGGSAARPWERVGASFSVPAAAGPPPPRPPLRPELQPTDAASPAAADALNDWALAAFREGAAAAAAEGFAEAARLNPRAAAYLGNLAAARLRCGDGRGAAEAARLCLALRPADARACVRLGRALLLQAEAAAAVRFGGGDRGRAALREARCAFAEAERLQPGSAEARAGAREAAIAWAAEFDSDEE